MNYQQYSDNTQQYLICFYEILNQMIADMTNASLSCSLSSDFINQMIPHHRAAIHMSRNLLMYTTKNKLKVSEICKIFKIAVYHHTILKTRLIHTLISIIVSHGQCLKACKMHQQTMILT